VSPLAGPDGGEGVTGGLLGSKLFPASGSTTSPVSGSTTSTARAGDQAETVPSESVQSGSAHSQKGLASHARRGERLPWDGSDTIRSGPRACFIANKGVIRRPSRIVIGSAFRPQMAVTQQPQLRSRIRAAQKRQSLVPMLICRLLVVRMFLRRRHCRRPWPIKKGALFGRPSFCLSPNRGLAPALGRT